MRLVDVDTLARAKTVVVQSDGALAEALAGIFCAGRMNAESGTAADAIEGVRRVGHDRKAEKRQKLSVEGTRGCEISSRDERMGNPIDFHGLSSPRVNPRTTCRRLQIGFASSYHECAGAGARLQGAADLRTSLDFVRLPCYWPLMIKWSRNFNLSHMTGFGWAVEGVAR
jgi:hypothetical protein